jgi:imidazolonepropionase-like amidohydrolase
LRKNVVFYVAALVFLTGLMSQDDTRLAITNAVVVDGRGGAPLENGTIILNGDRIQAVGPTQQIEIPPNARVIDAMGKTVLPGLADMHVHLIGGWDGHRVDMLGYQRYLNSLLYNGVTTVLDVGNVQPFILQMRQEVSAGRIPGPRIYCAGAVVDGSDPAWPPISHVAVSLAQIPKIAEGLKTAGVDVIKAYGGLSYRMVSALAAEAKKVALPLVVDQWSLNGSIDLMRTDMTAFAHLPARTIDEEGLALMTNKDIRVITTLAVAEFGTRRRFDNFDFLRDPLIQDTTPPWFLEDLREDMSRPLTDAERSQVDRAKPAFQLRKENAKKLFDAGVLLVAGTDAPYPGVFFGEGVHREMELLVEAGLTPLQAISIATSNAAKLMHAEEEWGTLAPGKLANLLIVNGRPDRRISDTRNIETVVKAGVVLDRRALQFGLEKDAGFRVGAPVSAPN